VKDPELDGRERALLKGAEGPALRLAMEILLRAARILAAPRLVPITFAHIDACFYAGEAHLDFAQFLLDHKARMAVPTWTNSGLVSLRDPALRSGDGCAGRTVAGARRLMELYAALGCRPVWTCAPYQLPGRPRLGDHIAAGESNAVTFYNSVIGARTNKYGDYLDVACALIGKAPLAGLHTDKGRRGEILIDASPVPESFRREDVFYHLLGHYVGRLAGQRIPVIEGLDPAASEDDLKALSAAAASSGGVEMWHGVGLTPEAPSRDAAVGGRPIEAHIVTANDIRRAQSELSSGRDGPLDMVALGTPHFSLSEFAALAALLSGRAIKGGVVVHVSTSRLVRALAAEQGLIAMLEKAGVNVVVDTCTYFAPSVRGARGRVMTNAAKWAYYAPGFLGVEVVFGSLRECVESAVRGEVWRDPSLWRGVS
jgi:predicted aconitase